MRLPATESRSETEPPTAMEDMEMDSEREESSPDTPAPPAAPAPRPVLLGDCRTRRLPCFGGCCAAVDSVPSLSSSAPFWGSRNARRPGGRQRCSTPMAGLCLGVHNATSCRLRSRASASAPPAGVGPTAAARWRRNAPSCSTTMRSGAAAAGSSSATVCTSRATASLVLRAGCAKSCSRGAPKEATWRSAWWNRASGVVSLPGAHSRLSRTPTTARDTRAETACTRSRPTTAATCAGE